MRSVSSLTNIATILLSGISWARSEFDWYWTYNHGNFDACDWKSSTEHFSLWEWVGGVVLRAGCRGCGSRRSGCRIVYAKCQRAQTHRAKYRNESNNTPRARTPCTRILFTISVSIYISGCREKQSFFFVASSTTIKKTYAIMVILRLFHQWAHWLPASSMFRTASWTSTHKCAFFTNNNWDCVCCSRWWDNIAQNSFSREPCTCSMQCAC